MATIQILRRVMSTAQLGSQEWLIERAAFPRTLPSISGSVLDVEMTILDKQSKGIPIDEQANDDVVHLDRFREADRLTD